MLNIIMDFLISEHTSDSFHEFGTSQIMQEHIISLPNDRDCGEGKIYEFLLSGNTNFFLKSNLERKDKLLHFNHRCTPTPREQLPQLCSVRISVYHKAIRLSVCVFLQMHINADHRIQVPSKVIGLTLMSPISYPDHLEVQKNKCPVTTVNPRRASNL